MGTHLIVNQGGEGQVVEEIGEELPHVRIPVLPQTLVVEPVHLRDLSTLVVASQDRHTVSVANLQRDEEGDRLDTVVSSVDVVSHEEVVGVGRVASNSEELRQVVLQVKSLARSLGVAEGTHELTVNVSTDGDGALDGLDVRLVDQDLSSLRAWTSAPWSLTRYPPQLTLSHSRLTSNSVSCLQSER